MNHKTVELQLGQGKVAIDELLAPLIRLVWGLKIRTLACCQEMWPGLAWIVFPSEDDVKRFLAVARMEFSVEPVEHWKRGRRLVFIHVVIRHGDIPHLVEAFENYQPEQ